MIVGRRKPDKTSASSGARGHSFYPAKKSLGQNFLVDDNIARKIVSAVTATPDDVIIEIGPGRGALTRLLAGTGAQVVAIEKDHRLAESLREEFSPFPHVEIATGDFLEYEFPLAGRMPKVVGNIPYNLTSQIVSGLVDGRERIDSAVLMVQDEVAARLSGEPGTKDYGAISVRLQLVAEVEKLFIVKPGCFRPRPRVDSRVIRITFTDRRPLEDENGFVRFVKNAFGMRRKMFRHFVADRYGKESVELLHERFRIGRVETFAPQELYGLFAILENHVRHE